MTLYSKQLTISTFNYVDTTQKTARIKYIKYAELLRELYLETILLWAKVQSEQMTFQSQTEDVYSFCCPELVPPEPGPQTFMIYLNSNPPPLVVRKS